MALAVLTTDRNGSCPLAWCRSGAAIKVATAVNLGRFGLSSHTPNLGPTTMTNDKIALRELLEKGSDVSFLS